MPRIEDFLFSEVSHFQNSSVITSGVGIFLSCDVHQDTSTLNRFYHIAAKGSHSFTLDFISARAIQTNIVLRRGHGSWSLSLF